VFSRSSVSVRTRRVVVTFVNIRRQTVDQVRISGLRHRRERKRNLEDLLEIVLGTKFDETIVRANSRRAYVAGQFGKIGAIERTFEPSWIDSDDDRKEVEC